MSVDGYPGAETGGTSYGPRKVVDEAIAPVAKSWADFEVTHFELTPAGDKVFVVGEYRGIHRASGKTGTARFVHVWHVQDGVAQRLEAVFDSHGLWRAAQSPIEGSA
jgi:ketosteroid isomerase-like protein